MLTLPIIYRKHSASFYSSQLDLRPYQVQVLENGNSEYSKDQGVYETIIRTVALYGIQCMFTEGGGGGPGLSPPPPPPTKDPAINDTLVEI